MTLNAEKRLCCNFSVEGKARVKSGLTHTATANKLTMETGKNLGLRTAATRLFVLIRSLPDQPNCRLRSAFGKSLVSLLFLGSAGTRRCSSTGTGATITSIFRPDREIQSGFFGWVSTSGESAFMGPTARTPLVVRLATAVFV
jgi:hypothetical protein